MSVKAKKSQGFLYGYHLPFDLRTRIRRLDLNPIELVFHPLKTALRKAAERTIEGLVRRARSFIRTLDPVECLGYLRHAGYEPL